MAADGLAPGVAKASTVRTLTLWNGDGRVFIESEFQQLGMVQYSEIVYQANTYLHSFKII